MFASRTALLPSPAGFAQERPVVDLDLSIPRSKVTLQGPPLWVCVQANCQAAETPMCCMVVRT